MILAAFVFSFMPACAHLLLALLDGVSVFLAPVALYKWLAELEFLNLYLTASSLKPLVRRSCC